MLKKISQNLIEFFLLQDAGVPGELDVLFAKMNVRFVEITNSVMVVPSGKI
jgi:hypothetical protein